MNFVPTTNTPAAPTRGDEGKAIGQDRSVPQVQHRLQVRGKFLFEGAEKVWVKGVTYGTFRPGAGDAQFPSASVVARDFAAMASCGLNALRVYTAPPRWLLDLAALHGLRVMVGLPWEQHITFLDDRVGATGIVGRVREAVRSCAGHPAVLCYAVGNEIPASVVRWYGQRRVESFLRELTRAVREEDPDALVTYVNFPTTEYLHLPFIDIVAFNVYLESEEKLAKYCGRLQNIAGERPLLMTEIGLDSRRNGELVQAQSLAWQIRTSFQGGCVGAFVFAWTDEWYRGGHEIEDWDFGLTTRDRRPKRALEAVSNAFASAPFCRENQWPRISVIVCSYNGSATIAETLNALETLDYPSYEVIVVDDGSTDGVSEIARQHSVRLIRQENRGLSAARNTGLHAATGEIVAYIDDDAYPDPHWLRYLAASFERSDHAGIGGPNLPPSGDCEIADCIANAPGGPIHVLLTDEIAEHIPGCNMAFRRDRLLAIGGFDERFWVAGDDVDVCWRLQERGWTLGFSPAAVVWHHRRKSIKRYLKQQQGYAKAEAILAEKWPAKYNNLGHLTWHGRLYGRGNVETLLRPPRIYHGTWGSALFQSVYEPAPGLLSSLPLMPEWYFLLLILGTLSALSIAWPPLLALVPVFGAAMVLTILQACRGAARANIQTLPNAKLRRIKHRGIVASLYFLQPAARLIGRMQHGLGPWRRRGFIRSVPVPNFRAIWCERWQATETRLAELERTLNQAGAVVVRGGDFDRWDLAVRGGLFGCVRTLAMVEEHGSGKQFFRLRAWPKVSVPALWLVAFLLAGAVLAAGDHAWVAALPLALAALSIGWWIYTDCAMAMRAWSDAVATYAQAER